MPIAKQGLRFRTLNLSEANYPMGPQTFNREILTVPSRLRACWVAAVRGSWIGAGVCEFVDPETRMWRVEAYFLCGDARRTFGEEEASLCGIVLSI